MALRIDFKSRFGLTVPGAYIRVTEIHNLRSGSALAVVSAYVDADKAPEQYIEQTGVDFPYDITGENPVAQAYEYLKTLPEFADATDV